MSSRDRVMTAVDHREPDRLPIDCGAMVSTTMQGIAYDSLKRHLGMAEGETRVYEVIQQVVEPEWSVIELFHGDAVNAGRDFDPAGWKEWVLPNGSRCQIPEYHDLRSEHGDWVAYNRSGRELARMIAGGTHFTQVFFPLDRADWPSLVKDLSRYDQDVCWSAMPEPMFAAGMSSENLEKIGGHVRKLRGITDKAIMFPFGGSLFEWSIRLRRLDNFLMDLALDPLNVEMLMDAMVETHLESLDKLLPVLGDNVDLIQLSDDLGTELGPFFSPEMFRRFFKPRYKVIIDRIKKTHPEMKVFLHSCGSIAPLLEDLIEVGIEVINPVQISAKNMEPAMLKKRFGDDLTFWGGGCDSQHLLSTGTPQQIKDEAKRNIDIFAPGGGYVFAPIHNILAEVPPENILALYEAAIES